jgi:uncharacterized low-complexity protein
MASKKTAVSVAVGSAFVAGMAMTPMANAAENPFALQSLDRGYMVADNHMHGKCGAGKCGGMKSGEAKCGMSMMDANKDGKVSKDEFMKAHEAMFNSKDANKDGVLGADEMKACMEGKCGGMKSSTPAAPAAATTPVAPAKPVEGKCGQGKCGGMK